MNAGAHPRRYRAGLLAALLAAAVATLCSETCAHLFQLGPIDDAYISLRYAANWAAGRGLAFNPGECVEGYSNFLLVLLEAALIRCGIDPVLAMTLIGRVALASLAALLAVFSYCHVFPRRAVLAGIVGSLAGLNALLVCWAHAGLEGCLQAVLLLAAVLAALATPCAAMAVLAALCLVLAALTRFESVVVFPVAVLALYLHSRSWRLSGLHAAVFLVGFGAYFVARAVHFGYMLPNTFYAKLDYGNALLAQRGVLYVWDFCRGSLPVCLLAGGALVRVRRGPQWVLACLLTVAVQVLATVYVGGDHFALFRFLVPVVPFLVLAALALAARVAEQPGRRPLVRHGAVTLTMVLITLSGVLVARTGLRHMPLRGGQIAGHRFECQRAREWEQVGRWFRHHAAADASIATVAIGAVGFYSDLRIVDPHGLVDPVIAHRAQTLGQGYAGHEKFDVAEVLARRPTYILVVHYLTRAPVPTEQLSQAAWGPFNQGLLRDPAVERDYRYEVVACGQQYLNMFVRRDAPALAGRAGFDFRGAPAILSGSGPLRETCDGRLRSD